MKIDLINLIKKFRRHYHKVRKVIPEFGGRDVSNLKIKYQNQKLHTKINTPAHEETIRLVVLMRKFLNKNDEMHYKKVWAFLIEHLGQLIPREVKEKIDERIELMNRGQIQLKVNDEELTAKDIYSLISKGRYFGNDNKIKRKLEEFSNIPIVGPTLWDQFYGYTLDGYYLISMIFDVIKKIEETDEYNSIINKEIESLNKCIYCLKNSESFTSEEHIIPEALGNDELILSKGYVCDTCNNGILSRLDNFLQGFELISFLRVVYTPYTKAGKLPKANYQNISIKKTHPRNILIAAKDKSGWIKNLKETEDGNVSFSIEMRGKKFDPKNIGRSLYKIGIGMVAFNQGIVTACDPKYNKAREFILSGTDFPNNLLISMNVKPHAQVRVMHQELSGGTGFVIDIFGVIFLLNLQPLPIMKLRKELKQANFKAFPLCN